MNIPVIAIPTITITEYVTSFPACTTENRKEEI